MPVLYVLREDDFKVCTTRDAKKINDAISNSDMFSLGAKFAGIDGRFRNVKNWDWAVW